MLLAPRTKDPIVLSYWPSESCRGSRLWTSLAVSIPLWILRHHLIDESSISGYYYTGMRNLFVGVSVPLACSCCVRGYDRKDEIAGVFSAFCALGVAFFQRPRIAAQRPAKVTWDCALHLCRTSVFDARLFLSCAFR